jgi:hypothetical protein
MLLNAVLPVFDGTMFESCRKHNLATFSNTADLWTTLLRGATNIRQVLIT